MRYFLGFLIAIGLIIFVVILLFSGGSKPKVAVNTKSLVSYANTDAAASLTIDGPVDSASIHQQVQITVDNDTVTYEQLQGYEGNVVNEQTFANNQNAYAAFLLSLVHAGFTKGNNSSALSDERGYCPLGDRYIFTFQQDAKQLERYWATTCGSPKTYQGNFALTAQLFENQVPNYQGLTQNLKL